MVKPLLDIMNARSIVELMTKSDLFLRLFAIVLLLLVGLGVGWSAAYAVSIPKGATTLDPPLSSPESWKRDFGKNVFMTPPAAPRVARVRVRVTADPVELYKRPRPSAASPPPTTLEPAVKTWPGAVTELDLWLVERPGETLAVADAGEGRRFTLYLRDPVFKDDCIEYTSRGYAMNWTVEAATGSSSSDGGQAWYGTAAEPRRAALMLGRDDVQIVGGLAGAVPRDGENGGARTFLRVELTLLEVASLDVAMKPRADLIVPVPAPTRERVQAWMSRDLQPTAEGER